MAKKLKCFVRESKKNAKSAGEFVKCGVIFLPQIIGVCILFMLPMVIAGLFYFVYPQFYEDHAAGIVGVAGAANILWIIIVATAFMDKYIIKDKSEKSFIERIIENVKSCISVTRYIPRLLVALVVASVPFIIGVYWLTTQHKGSDPATPMMAIELITMAVIELVWLALVAMPVIDCYLYPKAEPEKPAVNLTV